LLELSRYEHEDVVYCKRMGLNKNGSCDADRHFFDNETPRKKRKMSQKVIINR